MMDSASVSKVTFRSSLILSPCIFILLLVSASQGGRVVFPGQQVDTVAPFNSSLPPATASSSTEGTTIEATWSVSPLKSTSTEASLTTSSVTLSPLQVVNVTSPLSNISVSAVLQLKVPQPNVLNYNSIQALGISCYPRDTCLGSSGGRGGRFPDQHTAGQNCFCDQICAIYNDCCIDSPFKGKIGTTMTGATGGNSFACMDTHLGTFYIKATCPPNYEYVSDQTRANCESEAPESDPMRSIPVTAGSFTYKNAFCAQCNGVPSHEWVYWNTRLKVVPPDPEVPAEKWTTPKENETESISTAEIISHLANMSQRFIIENLVFVEEHKKWSLDLPQLLPEAVYFQFSASPPEYVTSTLRPCLKKVINSCPPEYHNRWVINACASYQARVFKTKDATLPPYRNVHCALCHGLNTFSEVGCLSPEARTPSFWSTPASFVPAMAPPVVESSFSILFDISATQDNQIPNKHEVATTVGHTKPCDSKFELYDPFRKKCRSLLCGLPDAQVIDGTCAPIQQSTTAATTTTTTTTAAATTVTATAITNSTLPSSDTNTSVNVSVSTVSIIDASEDAAEGGKSGSVGNSSLAIANETVTRADSSQTTSPPDLLTQAPTATTPREISFSSSTSSHGNLDSNGGHIDNSIVGQNEDAFTTTIKTIGDIVASTTSSPMHLNSSTKLAATSETSTVATIDSLDSFHSTLSNPSLPSAVVAKSESNPLSNSSSIEKDSKDTLSITKQQVPVAVVASNSSNIVNNSGNTSIIQEETSTDNTKDTNGTMDTAVSEIAPIDGEEKDDRIEREKENQFLGLQVVKNMQNLSSEFLNCTKINLDLANGTYTTMANGSLYLIEYDKVLHLDEYLVIYQNESLIHLAICSTWLQLAASHASKDQNSINKQLVASDGLSFDFFLRKLQSTLTLIGISISIICLMLHLIAFAILPEMRNLSGKNLASLATYLFIGYTCFLTRTLAPFWLNESPVICRVIGITMYHTFISSFIWSAILSFDVWRSLNLASTELRLTTGSQNVRFTMYTLVSVFISSTVSLIVVTKSLSPATLPLLPTASFSPPVCWFSSSASLITYFIIPVTVILVFNCCFFASISLLLTSAAKVTSATFSKSKQIKKPSSSSTSGSSSTRAVHASTSSATHSIQNDSKLYLKLSILMGLTWILGLIGTLVPNALIWLLFILLNTTQGLFIFCSFTLTEKVKRGLNERLTKSYIVKTLGRRLTAHGQTSTASNLSSSAGKT